MVELVPLLRLAESQVDVIALPSPVHVVDLKAKRAKGVPVNTSFVSPKVLRVLSRLLPPLEYSLDGREFDLDDGVCLGVVVGLEVEDLVGEDDAPRVHHQRSHLVANGLKRKE